VVGYVKYFGERRFGMVLRERISVSALVAGESGSITLKHAQPARKLSGSMLEALTANWRDFGQVVQLGLMVAILDAAALLLGLMPETGSVRCRMAMSGKLSD
jgi:hypothetical protein